MAVPVRWLRVAFFETVIRPLVWLLGKPKVVRSGRIDASEPMLVIANHVVSIDAALMEYALPGAIRRRMAVAMAGEMLEDYRHFRNAQSARPEATFFLLGPLYYLLVTMFFNVFPLPRRKDFQRSFAHAGEALDHGFNVLIFPEGAVSEEGRLARFRPGIGLLVKQSGTAVLPMAMRGVPELKASGRGWFRFGMIELVVGQPIRFGPLETEAAITARLHEEVEKLLEVQGSGVRDQGAESPR
jgi:long-chain acyl-CoA synthetase